MQNTKPSCDISVVIPLYNKASTIYTTLISVLAQSVRPREVIVIDDGSTDGSAEIVEQMIVEEPHVKLVRQANAGVSAARNRAIEMAQGEWVALLDGDDIWSPEYLKAVHEMIERWPECGAYGTGFYVEDNMRSIVGSTPKQTGKVDFFTESMHRYVLIPSATTLRRDLVLRLGGFPMGMRMGEDQYLWTKIAREAEVAFWAQPMIIYQKSASNRSASIYRAEQSEFSLEDLYDASASAISNMLHVWHWARRLSRVLVAVLIRRVGRWSSLPTILCPSVLSVRCVSSMLCHGGCVHRCLPPIIGWRGL